MAKHRAASLVEVLVVVSILAVLLGLLLPAVQRVREAASRAACGSHLRQLALVAHAHHDAHGAFPPARTDDDGGLSWLGVIAADLDVRGYDATRRYYAHPAAVRERPLPLLVCPSRRRAGVSVRDLDSRDYRVGGAPADAAATRGTVSDYAAVGGDGTTPTHLEHANGVLVLAAWSYRDGVVRWRSRTRAVDVVDGLSVTALVGEKFVPRGREGDAAANDGAATNGDPANQFAERPLGAAWRPGTRGGDGFALNHAGGGQFAFADGSVRLVTADADGRVLTATATRAGGD